MFHSEFPVTLGRYVSFMLSIHNCIYIEKNGPSVIDIFRMVIEILKICIWKGTSVTVASVYFKSFLAPNNNVCGLAFTTS